MSNSMYEKLDAIPAMSPEDRLILIREVVGAAIYMDGEHHKQWYLCQIAKVVGVDFEIDEDHEGIPP